MIEFVAFKPRHLAALKLQQAQAHAQCDMIEDHGTAVVKHSGRAFTALLDGRPIGCAGAVELWPGRAYGWAYLSEDALRHSRAIHRYALKALARMPWRRIEAYTEIGHAAAARWLLHLGFRFECVARAWGPDGRDVRQFARVVI
jgi:hypothetical protein